MTGPSTELQYDPKCPEFRARKRLVEIKLVPASEYPVRVLKRRTGVHLGQFLTEDEALAFVDKLSLESLQAKPASRKTSR